MANNGRLIQPIHTWLSTRFGMLSLGVLMISLKFIEVYTWLYWLIIILCTSVGIWFVVMYITYRQSAKWPQIPPEPPDSHAAKAFLTKLMGQRAQFIPSKNKVVTYSNLDDTIQKIIDLVIRDYALNWYGNLGADKERFQHLFNDFIWQVLEEFTRRLQEVDFSEFTTETVISIMTKHLKDIRKARKNSKSETPKPKFVLHPWLASEELEMEFIQQAAEVFLIHLLPKPYVQCVNARHLCREIVASKIFKPYIDSVCDPDFINQKLLSMLQTKDQTTKEHEGAYVHDANYDSYMKMIRDCEDLPHLEQIRQNIISDILHTVINNNFKKTPTENSPKKKLKSMCDIGKKLTGYMRQLSVAKSYCERRISSLGGPSYISNATQDNNHQLPGEKVLPFSMVMENRDARNHFMTYLSRSENDALLKYWTEVGAMRNQGIQSAREIYEEYLAPSCSSVRAVLKASTVLSIEQYLTGENGSDGFWSSLAEVYTTLQNTHYPDFIVSDVYYRFLADCQHSDDLCGKMCGRVTEVKQKVSHTNMHCLVAHLSYAQEKLEKLAEKLESNMQALLSLQTGQIGDEQHHNMKEAIEKEIQEMRTQKKQLEMHIEHTRVWIENKGKWKAHISNAEIIQDEGKMVPYFVLVVHEVGAVTVSSHAVSSTHGWVVFRRLDDFYALNSQLAHIQPSPQPQQLPTVSKSRVKSMDTAFLNSAKLKLQDYINEVLADESLSHTEAVFAFLSPSPEYLRPANISHTTTAGLTTLHNGTNCIKECDSDDGLHFCGSLKHSDDSKAAGLYKLLSEVFETRCVMHRLCEILRVFVQVTFGRTINRHIHKTVKWLYSETMLIYYLESFIHAHWPHGTLIPISVHRSPQQQHTTRVLVKQALLANIPVTLKNLVGDSSSKHGMTKLFEAFQDTRLNKHLLYSLLQAFMLEVFPELKAFQKQATPESGTECCEAQ